MFSRKLVTVIGLFICLNQSHGLSFRNLEDHGSLSFIDNVKRQAIPPQRPGTGLPHNCSDLSTGLGNDCIATLNIPEYVQSWLNTHQCNAGEAFGNCFLRQSGAQGYDCTTLTTTITDNVTALNGACPLPFQNIFTTPEQFYTARNIIVIRSFFQTWYVALQVATAKARADLSLIASILLRVVDPIRPIQQLQTEMLILIDGITQQINDDLAKQLLSVQTNSTEFLAFAGQANLSAGVVDLPSAQEYVSSGFMSYFASYVLSLSSVYGTVARNTSVQDLVSNGTTLAYPLTCDSLDSSGVCDAWWFSQNLNSSFGLVSTNNPSFNYGPTLSSLFGADRARGDMMFEGPYLYKSIPGYPPSVNVTAQGINMASFAQLQVYEWDRACHVDPTATGDSYSKCEFADGPPQPGFWLSSPRVPRARWVPAAYLGPAITQNTFTISRT